MGINIGGGFPVIYTDCPWEYDNPQDHDSARGGTPYKQMSVKDLSAMAPLIDQVAAKDCILFHWATFPKLREALAVMEAWGFEYTTNAFTWVKLNARGKIIVPKMNMVMVGADKNGGSDGFALSPKDIILKGGVRSGQGYYTNANAEICLVGKRGKTTELRQSRSVKQIIFAPDWEEYAATYPDTDVIIAPMLGHSAKPEEARARIEMLTGNVPGLELFARPPGRVPGWVKLGWEIDEEDISVMLERLIDGEYRRPKAA
jgi:N6-adenosine-specific RNA methylase IME4